MGKNLPLLKRLEIALSQGSSATSQDKYCGIVYEIVNSEKELILKNGIAYQDSFYSHIKPETFTQQLENENSIDKGKYLVEELRSRVVLPRPGGQVAGYRKKMKDAMDEEYRFLREYCSKLV